jgi:hypothetical protein
MGDDKPTIWQRIAAFLRLGQPIAGAYAYLKLFGIWALISPWALALAAVVTGYIEGLPWTQIGTSAVTVFAAVSALVIGIRAHRDVRRVTELAEPAYEYWDDVHEFMVFQAAALWEGVDPYDPRAQANQRIASARTMLKTAIGAGKIVALDHNIIGVVRTDFTRPEINMHTFVAREELRKLAELRGDSPRFLFPPQRVIPPPPLPKLPAT